MKRRLFLGLLSAAVFSAGVAEAKDLSDDVVRQLKRNGYKVLSVSRTLLGRTRIRAAKGGGEREIIMNAATGEILRDVWIAGSSGAVLLDDRDESEDEDGDNSGPGSGDDDDKDNEDEDGDDNSGSGGGGDDGGDGGDGEDD